MRLNHKGALALAVLALVMSARGAAEDRVTAAEVVDRATLKAFVEGAKAEFEAITEVDEGAKLRDRLRQEGPLKSGSMFLIMFLQSGEPFIHGNDRSAESKNLIDVEDDNGKKVVQELLAAGNRGGDFVEYHDGEPKTAYAVAYTSGITGRVFVLVGGWSQDVSHVPFKAAAQLPTPDVTASEVRDRETLIAFVEEAAEVYREAVQTQGYSALIGIRNAFRTEGGDWKSGSIYLWVVSAGGVTLFHAIEPFREGKPTDLTRTDVNGVKFAEELVVGARREGRKFVRYHYDDPTIIGDEDTGSPKLGYAVSFSVPNSDQKAVIGSGIYIRTTESIPKSWLSRFGREVTEQVLDGVADRIEAHRAPGFSGTIAGRSLAFGEAGDRVAAGGTSGGPALSPWQRTLGGFAASLGTFAGYGQGGALGHNAGYGGTAELGHGSAFGLGAGLGPPGAVGGARGFGAVPGIGGAAGMSYGGARMGLAGYGGNPGLVGGMRAARDPLAELLVGSEFGFTQEEDGAGGSLAVWGRGAYTSFGGLDQGLSLDGGVTTGLVGTDYARGRWLTGVAVSRSWGDGGYAGTGEGELESTLTAVTPYFAYQAREGLDVWGAAGYGVGGVTVMEAEEVMDTDIGWAMTAMGARGDLIAMPDSGGFSLALVSDAMWTQTTSDAAPGLVSSSASVSRLRMGIEAGWTVLLGGGGSLTPRVETGMRHDGGDAENGIGVEVGGGINWSMPGVGLALDVEARTLLAHADDEFTDRGFAAQLVFDPSPATQRGPSLSLRQASGGMPSGGLDALFAPHPMYGGGGYGPGRWTAEAAWGLPAFGEGFTGSPHVTYGLSGFAREYGVGWRLAPERLAEHHLSLDVLATRREWGGEWSEYMTGVFGDVGAPAVGSGAADHGGRLGLRVAW